MLDASYEVRAAAGKIYVDTAVMNSLQKAVGSQGHFLYFPRTRERSEHYRAMAGYLRGGSCSSSAAVNQRLGCLRQNIAHHHRVAGLLDISSNGAADGA